MKGYISPFLKGLELPSYNLKDTSSIFNHYFTKFYLLCIYVNIITELLVIVNIAFVEKHTCLSVTMYKFD